MIFALTNKCIEVWRVSTCCAQEPEFLTLMHDAVDVCVSVIALNARTVRVQLPNLHIWEDWYPN
jgi:hypothetical protein